MDIQEALKREHTKENTLKIVDYIGTDANKFNELMDVFFSKDVRLTQRASWVMNFCVEEYPKLIYPYVESMTLLLDKPVHDAVKRNIVRVFQFIELPEEHHGLVIDECFKLLANRKAAVAIRAFCITVIDKFLSTYPEIENEFVAILESEYEYTTAAFKSRARKVLKRLAKKRTDSN